MSYEETTTLPDGTSAKFAFKTIDGKLSFGLTFTPEPKDRKSYMNRPEVIAFTHAAMNNARTTIEAAMANG